VISKLSLWHKPILAAALVTSFVAYSAIVPSNAQATGYTCYNGGMPSKIIGLQYSAVNSTWQDGFTTARGRWNSAGVGASITIYGGSPSYMTAGNYTNYSWYGLYTPYSALFGGVGSFGIKVNATTLNRNAPSGKYWTWVLSTSTHELGHALRLPDNPATATPNIALMNQNRDRSTVGFPTSYDKANVKACF